MSDFDAIIISAGIFGCGIANELTARGLKTCNIDMNSAPGMGSTSSSGAIVRFTYSTVDGVRMAWEGNQYWVHFDDVVSSGDHPNGVAEKITTGSAFLNSHAEITQLWVRCLTEAGVTFEEWTAEQLVEKYPFVTAARYGGPCLPDDDAFWADPVGEIPGALWTPDAGYISDPQLAAQNLASAAEAQGGTFRFNSRVSDIVLDESGRAVAGVELTDGSVVSAPVVINVGGPWSSRVNELAGLAEAMNIRTAPMRHEAHMLPAPEGLDFEADGTIIGDLDQGMYFRPHAGNHIFVGSTDPECDGHDWVDDLDSLNKEITEPIWNRQMLRVSKRVPEAGVPHQRMGLAEAYDVSTDWGPIYDRTDLDGFFVAIGTSGNQFKNACVASHLMAELVTAVGSGHDHDADPLVVTGRFTGTPINMGAFSRNRKVNADSTNSVMG